MMTYEEAIEFLKMESAIRYPSELSVAIKIILSKERYTKQEFLNAAEMGEVSMIDAKHTVSLLDELKEKK